MAQTITVLTHDSFALDKALIAKFEAESGIKLRFLKGGDAGEMLNKAILSRGAPIADVIYGFDNTMLSRALGAGILEPYRSPQLPSLRPETRLDPSNRALPVDYGYVCLNYDKAYFASRPLPRQLADLGKPEFAKLLVVPNPATSSPGLAFMLATVQTLGEERWLGFWADLRRGGVRVVGGWSDAYYTHFSSKGGDRPLVVSYCTSPAAELFYSEANPKPAEPPTANLELPGSGFFQVEFVGILKGGKNLPAARRFVDWLLSPAAQADIPTQMWVYPSRAQTALPEVFRFATTPRQPAAVSPERIAANRDRWIREWTRTVLQR